jgi:diguanylate cyclase (GGDEF)-like protein
MVAEVLVATVLVYLAASQAGPLAAALAALLGTSLIVIFHASRVAQLVRLVERYARLSQIDDLTGLANDRSFREELRRFDSSISSPALALIDVDRFKAYNDAFGHRAGDDALREIGEIVTQFSGESGRVYRLGGDEFAVLLSNLDAPGPVETAEAIRREVADHGWTLRPITVSIGLDPDIEPDGSSVFESADRRLYRAKSEGGNRVIHQPIETFPSG